MVILRAILKGCWLALEELKRKKEEKKEKTISPSELDDAFALAGHAYLVHRGKLLAGAFALLAGGKGLRDRDLGGPAAYRAGLVEVHGVVALAFAEGAGYNGLPFGLLHLHVLSLVHSTDVACPSIGDRDRRLVRVGLALDTVGLLRVVLLLLDLHRLLDDLDGLLLGAKSLARDLLVPTVPAKLHVVLKARVASGTVRNIYHRTTTR